MFDYFVALVLCRRFLFFRYGILITFPFLCLYLQFLILFTYFSSIKMWSIWFLILLPRGVDVSERISFWWQKKTFPLHVSLIFVHYWFAFLCSLFPIFTFLPSVFLSLRSLLFLYRGFVYFFYFFIVSVFNLRFFDFSGCLNIYNAYLPISTSYLSLNCNLSL